MKNKLYDVVYHLSDTDLDGFSSQYLMSLTNEDIVFYNSRISDFKEKLNMIKGEILNNKGKKVLLLITDICLREKDLKNLINFKRSNRHIDINYQIIDHHKTDSIVLENEFYICNYKKCATKLTSDYILNNYTFNQEISEQITYLGDFVDAHDRWVKDSKWFGKSNMLSSYLFEKLKLFDEIDLYKREIFFYFIENITVYLKDNNIWDFELYEPNIRINFLKDKIPEDLYLNKNIETKDKFHYYYMTLYKEVKTKTFEIKTPNDKKVTFKMFFNLSSNIYQNLSHYYLDETPEIGFMINIKSKGNMSFRSVKEDVEIIARTYFNGGGHELASGGKMKLPNEIHSKEELEKFLITIPLIEEVGHEVPNT